MTERTIEFPYGKNSSATMIEAQVQAHVQQDRVSPVFWNGSISFLCFSEINNSQAFFDSMRAAVRAGGIMGRMVGSDQGRFMTGLSIKHRSDFSPEEVVRYGEFPELRCIITINYRTNYVQEQTHERF